MFNKKESYKTLREKMVAEQIVARDIQDEAVVSAMLNVPRHEFVPKEYRKYSYSDTPLPIGEGQTISQPYVVALMTELLGLKKGDKLLDVGTGSGYQTAILSEMGCIVYTIEIVESLAKKAQNTLQKLGYKNIYFLIGDGYMGWEQHSPYDAILVAAAPKVLPDPLVNQLKVGGKMVIPIEEDHQELSLIEKKEESLDIQTVGPVRFVPMTGEVQRGALH